MKNLIYIIIFLISCQPLISQSANDLKKSVPAWFEYSEQSNEAKIKLFNDANATKYDIQEINYEPFVHGATVGTLDAGVDSFLIGDFEKGKLYEYKFLKYFGQNGAEGFGFLNLGVELPLVERRGKCLILIESSIHLDLIEEIATLKSDMELDGWQTDTLVVLDNSVTNVKSQIQNWYDGGYGLSQSVLLLGHIAVPYSGNSAIDGHPDHQGAWSSDTYYADIDGNWTDNSVNNTIASRAANDNIPGDGKFDQTIIPSSLELEIGRVDFSNLPAFSENEIELTRNYLNKNHEFRIGNKQLARKAIVENNFGSFAEGFGQNGWRNFVAMFGKDEVAVGNYDVKLETEGHLFSYACGGGSYTSCSGVGTTQNLWASKDLQTIFTMNFGSYFGDWDSQNNFLRSALGSGDILANMWAGRPNWYLHSMALGQHLGYCAKLSQNASSFYSTGFGARQTHMALMGDPTLRLHPVKVVTNLMAEESAGGINISWDDSADADQGYHIYRRTATTDWEMVMAFYSENNYEDVCLEKDVEYEYMVKAIKLEESASGSYYNSSQGVLVTSQTTNSSQPIAAFEYSSDYEMITFQNMSENGDTYSWDYGDGATSNEENVSHLFDTTGIYTVCLTIENASCNLTDQICEEINVIHSIPDDVGFEIVEPSCFGFDDGYIVVNYQTGADGLIQLWNTGAEGDTLHNIGAGEYWLSLDYPATGSMRIDTILVSEPEELIVEVEVIDNGDGTATAVPTITGGMEPYILYWGFEIMPGHLFDGEYVLLVTDANECSVKVEFVVNVTNLSSAEQLREFKLYPNPASSSFTLENSLKGNEKLKVSLIDQNGIRMPLDEFEIIDEYTTFKIDHLRIGMYTVRVEIGDKIEYSRLIKI